MFRLWIVFLFVWAGCVSAETPDGNARTGFHDVTVRFDERRDAQWLLPTPDYLIKYAPLPEGLQQYIVYFDQSGRAYVWVPGRPVVFQTAWDYTIIKARRKGQTADQAVVSEISALCFDQFWTSGELCRNVAQLRQSIAQAAVGDIFNLKSRTEPCRTCRPGDSFSTIEDVARWE